MMFPHTAKHIESMLNQIKNCKLFLRIRRLLTLNNIYEYLYRAVRRVIVYMVQVKNKTRAPHIDFTKNMQMEFVEHFYANLT